MAGNTVNFFQPGTEAAIDASSIMRQRELAKLLMQKGIEGQQGQMVSGHYVAPGALSYVNQLASALGGKYLGDKADERELALGKQLRAQNATEAQQFAQALQGTPAQPGREIQPLTPNDDEGNAMPVAKAEGTAAVPGDINRAIALAMQSQNPMVSGMAPELMKRQLDAAELQQALQSAGLSGVGGGMGAPAGGGGPAIAGAPGAGLPEGISPQAAALTLSRNAQANKLGGMIQDANKPQTLAEGGTLVTPGGRIIMTAPKTEAGIAVQNGRAVPVPGFVEAQADRAGQVAGAEAKARDPYAGLVKIGDRWLTPAQARAEAQGGTPPVPGMNGPAGPTNAAERVMATNVADTLQGNEARLIEGVRRDLATPGAITNPQDRRNAEQYLALMEQRAAPQGAGAGRGGQGGPGIQVASDEQKAYGEARAKGFAEQASKVQAGGQSAASTLRNLDQLETIYKDPNVAKGALAENISGLKNLGASFGIDMKGLSSEQAAEAITNKMSLESRSTAEGGGMPGAMSDADRNFLKNMQPGLSKTPEGRAIIIDAARKTAQRQIDVAHLATQYEQQNGRLDAGFDKVVRDYAAKNQMFTQPKKGGGFKVLGVQ